jgi:hypothetical protein
MVRNRVSSTGEWERTMPDENGEPHTYIEKCPPLVSAEQFEGRG